jgi:hypothetical protein
MYLPVARAPSSTRAKWKCGAASGGTSGVGAQRRNVAGPPVQQGKGDLQPPRTLGHVATYDVVQRRRPPATTRCRRVSPYSAKTRKGLHKQAFSLSRCSWTRVLVEPRPQRSARDEKPLIIAVELAQDVIELAGGYRLADGVQDAAGPVTRLRDARRPGRGARGFRVLPSAMPRPCDPAPRHRSCSHVPGGDGSDHRDERGRLALLPGTASGAVGRRTRLLALRDPGHLLRSWCPVAARCGHRDVRPRRLAPHHRKHAARHAGSLTQNRARKMSGAAVTTPLQGGCVR